MYLCTYIHTHKEKTYNSITMLMIMSKPYYYTLIIFLSLVLSVCTTAHKNSNSKTYIVHVTKPDEIHVDLKTYHESFLPSEATSGDDQQRAPIIYSYKQVISGFSAKLTPEELEFVKSKPGFISADDEESILRPHTTHSPDFLGLHLDQSGLWKGSNYGRGTIIGLIDTGILPNHPSFHDKGVPPPPKRWRGKCDPEFTNASSPYRCNNKLIGARYFAADGPVRTLLDSAGHGTHTASIAAGNFVPNASVSGNGLGTAAGMAPLAHLAIYKVCTTDCRRSDVLAGLDAAIEDGVDVISVSLGKVGPVNPFYRDINVIASFAAVQKGIFVSCSAGNSGPTGRTLVNDAPWILTVGASTMDRSIRATAKLGDGREFDGESAFQPSDFSSAAQLPLVYPPGGRCDGGFSKGVDVKGKIVLCDQSDDYSGLELGQFLKNQSASGMILANDEPTGSTVMVQVHVLPATAVSFVAGEKIKAYINSTKNPTATIAFKGTVMGDPTAPSVASFSSRGPSARSPGILKPDIIGPGVNVLAAWPLSLDNSQRLDPTFNFLSGTSMACPHLSGIAALLRSVHPSWSPAAIKSAIMTTADIVNMKGQPIVDQTLGRADFYGTGSGHVNPSRANDPGLVYDISADDYVPYICGLKDYTEEQVGMIVGRKVSCATKIREGDLNYPTFAVELGTMTGSSKSYVRTVTNVGSASSSYSVRVVEPKGVSVSVVPQKLVFKGLGDKLSYNVTFTGNNVSEGFSQGYLEWFSGKYIVRSAILASFA